MHWLIDLSEKWWKTTNATSVKCRERHLTTEFDPHIFYMMFIRHASSAEIIAALVAHRTYLGQPALKTNSEAVTAARATLYAATDRIQHFVKCIEK
jgi:hypothetical protein